MVKKKRQSKRISNKDKNKIRKKVIQHHRKQRKLAKKGIITKHNRLRKDPGIPNLLPYKEKFIQDLKEVKEREVAHNNRLMFSKRAAMVQKAMEQNEETKTPKEDSQAKPKFTKEKRSFMKELNEVVKQSDIILYVLDARDPLSSIAGTKFLSNLEEKKLILVLNKIDLISKQNVDQWLSFLRNEYKLPVIGFRASTQKQKHSLGRVREDNLGLNDNQKQNNRICLGGEKLLELIKNYSRVDGTQKKTGVVVGVVGFPNVGKSSIINSLKRDKAVGVSSVAGFTRSLSIVGIDSKVKLIDSPGVLFDNENDKTAISLFSTNLEKEANCADLAESVFEKLVKQPNRKEELLIKYRLEDFGDSKQKFLCNLARARGKLLKGGIADQEAAAKIFLQDVQSGKISYAVEPPEFEAVGMELDE